MTLTGDEELEFKFITSEHPQLSFPLQTQKTIFAVYGIGESVSNIMTAYKFLEDYSKKFQFSVLWKLFCFEPSLEDNKFESKAPNLILFHPNTGNEKLLMNVGIVMNDLAYWVLVGLMALLKDYSSRDAIGTPEEGDLSKVKKKKQGRYTKMHGDLCLLFGNFQEATRKYEESLDKYKSQIDWVWMASIQESLACIACYKGNYDQASSRFTEAENNYLKARNGRLNIECQFRFARFMILSGKKVKAVKKLARLLDSNIDGTDQNDKHLISKHLAFLCKEIGFERKAGFFLRLAASCCLDQNMSEAHDLLKKSAEAYLAIEEKHLPQDRGKEFDRELFIIRENLKPWMRGDFSGWRNLQKVTLEHLKAIAKKIGDIDSSVKYTWNLLLNSVMEPDFQDQLRQEIEQDSHHLSLTHCFRSPVQLISIMPLENKLEINQQPGGIFIYNPWTQKKLIWIKGSIHYVHVVVQHKLSFNLHVEQTKLIVEGDAECLPSKF
jgi:tetratricopeptide (TPR) repeat protein